MAAWVGGAGPSAFGGGELPKPGAVIMQYTGLSEASPGDPPTFAVAVGRDSIADARIMKARIDRLKTLGIPAEFVCFSTLGHGFGLGTGTEAQGWLERACLLESSDAKFLTLAAEKAKHHLCEQLSLSARTEARDSAPF